MIKLSDYVVRFLADRGVTDLFMVSGGGIIHLVDSVGRSGDIRYHCNYNEQATAYCAEGYARHRNGVGVCLVTTGPGSTNALSGVASAWVDSVPLVVISGQVKRELIADYSRLRQIGEQEINIVDMARPVTKYAVTVTDPRSIRRVLEEAFHQATTGRPGPVWVNIPLDVQGSQVDEEALPAFVPTDGGADTPGLAAQTARAIELLAAAKRPLLLFGYGVRLARAVPLMEELLERHAIPAVLSFSGMDLLPDDHPLLVGKPGIIGQRRANFAVQNADCLLVVGSRLNIKIVGYQYRDFAPRATKIVVDIDPAELQKPTVNPDLPVRADAGAFLREFLLQTRGRRLAAPERWLAACSAWKWRFPNIDPAFFEDREHVNTYVFFDRLSEALEAEDTVVTANGSAALCLYQAFRVRRGQRAYTNNGYGAMGWGLPAASGACVAARGRTICVEGDGSIQMNIQELEFVRHHRLPLKIFVLNNRGYTSIRLSQDGLFEGFRVGADEGSGVACSDFGKLAEAYGLGYARMTTNEEIGTVLASVLASEGPVLCDVAVSPDQGISPKVTSFRRPDGSFESRPLHDMYPFLPRGELQEIMSISENDDDGSGE